MLMIKMNPSFFLLFEPFLHRSAYFVLVSAMCLMPIKNQVEGGLSNFFM